jgi:hypothetical protein
MKKGLIFLLTLFIFISLNAQIEGNFEPTTPEPIKKGQSNFKGGFKGGFTCSILSGDNFGFEGYNKFGGFFGAFVNIAVSKNGRWLIQPEMNFIMKGCKHFQKFDENGDPFRDSYRVQLMYGQMPILAKWKIIKGFEVEFGTAFGILIKNTDIEWVNKELNVGAPPFARFEFSAIVGGGYLFRNHWGVNLRFEGSLLPIRKPRASDWSYLFRGQFNQSFIFSAYYQF